MESLKVSLINNYKKVLAACFCFNPWDNVLLHLSNAESGYPELFVRCLCYPVVFDEFAKARAGYFAAFAQLCLQLLL